VPPERREQLGRGEFQAQGEEQQDDADLGRRHQERLGGAQRDEAAVPQRECGDQDEGDG
jgi:hypothetical protein